jgi:hypothetical protein
MIGTAMPEREPNRRILPFRPRGSLFARPVPRPSPVEDLAKYERGPEEPGEYRHRMLMNGLAFAVTILLVAAGIWIADVMAQMRKNQDCVLMGRPGCTPVHAPPQQR